MKKYIKNIVILMLIINFWSCIISMEIGHPVKCEQDVIVVENPETISKHLRDRWELYSTKSNLANVDDLISKLSLEELVMSINLFNNLSISSLYCHLNGNRPLVYRFFENINMRLRRDVNLLLAIADDAFSDLTGKQCVPTEEVEKQFARYNKIEEKYCILGKIELKFTISNFVKSAMYRHCDNIAFFLLKIDREKGLLFNDRIAYEYTKKIQKEKLRINQVLYVKEYVMKMIELRKFRDANPKIWCKLLKDGANKECEGQLDDELQKYASKKDERDDDKKQLQMTDLFEANGDPNNDTQHEADQLKGQERQVPLQFKKQVKQNSEIDSSNSPQKGMSWQKIMALLIAGGGLCLLVKYLMQQKGFACMMQEDFYNFANFSKFLFGPAKSNLSSSLII